MKKYIISALALAAVLSTISVAHANTRPSAGHTTRSPKTELASSTQSTQYEQALTYRISQYSAFESNMPPSISGSDRSLLSSELASSIARMQTTLVALKSATTTLATDLALRSESAGATMSDALLSVKIALLNIAFHPIYHRTLHAHTASSTVSFVPSATSNVSSALVDQVINLSSLADASALAKQVVVENASSSIATTAASTTN
jgi:hypothetical protein